MSESAAITLHLAALTGRDDLVAGPDKPERAAFLRRLIFLVAQAYPCFTFGDDPARFLSEAPAQAELGEAVAARLQELWTVLDGVAGAPWFPGERFSALDNYAAAITNWKPGPSGSRPMPRRSGPSRRPRRRGRQSRRLGGAISPDYSAASSAWIACAAARGSAACQIGRPTTI
ncbi:hypothetical protein [Paracoccus aminovorans]|nr:hypothetical protein [Paracoccus aminovorans]